VCCALLVGFFGISIELYRGRRKLDQLMKIVTDSTADLPKELVEEYDIEIVPLTVRLGDKTFRDYFDLSPVEFYQMLSETEDFPTTSQPSVEEFLRTYKKLGDKEKIISIHISMELSKTCQSASVALQQLPDCDVTIIDSRSASVGLGLMVLEAAKAAKAGADAEEVIALVERLKSEIKVYFSLDSLDYLQKGGRIGKAQAFVGAMLKIKPLLALQGGLIVPVERIRGSSRLIRRMTELVKVDAKENRIVKASFVWGESDKQMTELVSQLNDSVQLDELYRSNIGTVITSHVGPTAFGIGYFCDDL
jgi:DegV family protein with EDD domain